QRCSVVYVFRQLASGSGGHAAAVTTSSVFREGIVSIAVQPALTRLGGSDDWVTARPRVFGCVAVGRVVATQRRAAFLARAQMDPRRTDLDAFVALSAPRMLDRGDSRYVRAGFSGLHG